MLSEAHRKKIKLPCLAGPTFYLHTRYYLKIYPPNKCFRWIIIMARLCATSQFKHPRQFAPQILSDFVLSTYIPVCILKCSGDTYKIPYFHIFGSFCWYLPVVLLRTEDAPKIEQSTELFVRLQKIVQLVLNNIVRELEATRITMEECYHMVLSLDQQQTKVAKVCG